MNALHVFQPLINAGILEKVQDEKGNSIEYWSSIGWWNGIGNLNPGKGYLVQVSNDATLRIDAQSEKSIGIFTMNSEPDYFKVDYSGNGFAHMNINITGLKESGLNVGDEIAVYDEEFCVGAIQLNELHFEINGVSIPASASDKIEGIGFYEGNTVRFRIWRQFNKVIIDFTPDVIEGELKFSQYSSLFVSFNNFENITENIEIYPNPANRIVTIEIPVVPQEGVTVLLFDATGKKLFTKIINSNREQLNVESLPAGLYFLKAYLKDKILTHKLVIT
jgi:hypothetical protein